jgi:putative transposase
MPDYRRLYIPGGTYFLTVNLQDRRVSTLTDHIDDFRGSVHQAKNSKPFVILAMVVLPDHFHCLMSLPPCDDDFSSLIGLIKSNFSRCLPRHEEISTSRKNKRERGIWQRRFFEHCIRDEQDLENHVNYIHFNPVKHGYVARPAD